MQFGLSLRLVINPTMDHDRSIYLLSHWLYHIYIEVMHENAYLSRTIAVQEVQQLIDT